MNKTLKVLSALLTYPTVEMQQAVSEMQDVVCKEGKLTGKLRRALEPIFEEIKSGEIYDLQERYVLLFDRTRSLSLHLFEHVHGESRDRGQAMVDLQNLYAISSRCFWNSFRRFRCRKPMTCLASQGISSWLWPSGCASVPPPTKPCFAR